LDSLIALPQYEIEHLQSRKRFSLQFDNIDTGYKALLLNISRPQNHTIDVSKIKLKYPFTIKDTEAGSARSDEMNVGWIELSNIGFSHDGIKACIYASLSKGGFEYGYIYFLEKTNNDWRFVRIQPE